ncbi:MAG TPA: hypothetical protein VMS22_15815 [Candidatus Eisenbacteria bacterium]|nr:hypothetical protein [Candidatus Eisenbacteria bacterium]
MIPAESRQHFRFVRPAVGTGIMAIGWWPHWGVHEIELYETAAGAGPTPG